MKELNCENPLIDGDKPDGGSAEVVSINIDLQNEPLKKGKDRKEPSVVETIIYSALQRLKYCQKGLFKCRENDFAITKLEEANMWLSSRTLRREDEGTEGTHEGN